MKKIWILSHSDLDLGPKITNFDKIWASAVSNHLAKIASKSVHPFGWNFVHKQSRTNTHTDRHTDRDKLQWKYNPSTISWRCNKRATPKWITKSYIWDMVYFLFSSILWPWSVTLDQGQCHLGHEICVIGLYIGTKYLVCG